VKLNDYYEFKEDIDIAEYTHEYLTAKEKAQKAQKNDEEGESKADSKEELLKSLM
jgi:F0F1-type ATP synthase epsilon subunit